MSERIDLTGQRFGAWTVLGEARKKDNLTKYTQIFDFKFPKSKHGKTVTLLRLITSIFNIRTIMTCLFLYTQIS